MELQSARPQRAVCDLFAEDDDDVEVGIPMGAAVAVLGEEPLQGMNAETGRTFKYLRVEYAGHHLSIPEDWLAPLAS
ncbi:MAG: hypothetical protein Athens041674_428 [Parcubacteria group bacterium Athens0416_74]|nr:MAG: hypothetical protein Athens041674_428 [Parcubacteria group bacterium Athens0416_74]